MGPTPGSSGGSSESRPADRTASWFVWGVWLAMVLVAFGCILVVGRDVPLAEDWLLVWPLSGNEPDLPAWLWAQNNEHRVPLPRALLLVLLTITGDDFRAGMVVNVTILAALSASMIVVARRLRSGRTLLWDAFFPLLLLHVGHWENLFWSWQLSQVLPTALACVVLLVFVRSRSLTPPRTVLTLAACLLLLPLSGANGILFVPLTAFWLVYVVVVRPRQSQEGPSWIRGVAVGAAVLAVALCAVYFVGYDRPTWKPENPGLVPTASVAARFLTFGLGPAVLHAWGPAALAGGGLLISSAVMVVAGTWRSAPRERRRAAALLIFLVNMAGFAVIFGWGRAGVILRDNNWPLRYVLMAAPAFCAAYFGWLLYGPTRLRTAGQAVFCVIALMFAPVNIQAGLEWARWYDGGMRSLERDISAGLPADSLARRHRSFLVHWWAEPTLADGMRLLKEMGVGPFAKMRAEAASSDPGPGGGLATDGELDRTPSR